MMDCSQFQNIVGMRCNQLGDAIEIVTPFTFSDGDGFEIFAQSIGNKILFFDDGYCLQHMRSVGISIGQGKNRWRSIRAIAEKYQVSLSTDGVLEYLCNAEDASVGFAKTVSAIMEIATWERKEIGVAQDADWFLDEVAMYLRAWKQGKNLIEKPFTNGFSGRSLGCDFEIEGQYVDAIQPNSNSAAAEVRKLLDYTSVPSHDRNKVIVVVDDRRNAEAAKQEISLIGLLASAWPMSKLIETSGFIGTTQ
jgi:hypothetical protein